MRWGTTSRDEPMVISVVVADFKIERVLIDQGSSANILYRSTYRRMGLSESKETSGCLYGFSGERVPIRGTVELDMVFGEGSSARVIPVLYTVVEVEASYNIIIGRPALNQLKAIVSTYHLCMKYPMGSGVGSVWADSHMARKCYEDSLRVGQRVNALSLEFDPRVATNAKDLIRSKDLKRCIRMGPRGYARDRSNFHVPTTLDDARSTSSHVEEAKARGGKKKGYTKRNQQAIGG
ncbi:hypothetical protein CR513_58483, partial [Mucuna pruriens]